MDGKNDITDNHFEQTEMETANEDSIEAYCQRAARDLIIKKYEMLTEVSQYVEKYNIDGHELHVLRSFHDIFSKSIHRFIDDAQAISNIDLRHLILIDFSTAITMSNSLGNFGKMNFFLEQRKKEEVAARTAHARNGKTDLSERDEDILRRAQRLQSAKPRTRKSVLAMARAIEEECRNLRPGLTTEAIRKVLSRELKNWKIEYAAR